jgi:hypothetical protein
LPFVFDFLPFIVFVSGLAAPLTSFWCFLLIYVIERQKILHSSLGSMSKYLSEMCSCPRGCTVGYITDGMMRSTPSLSEHLNNLKAQFTQSLCLPHLVVHGLLDVHPEGLPF